MSFVNSVTYMLQITLIYILAHGDYRELISVMSEVGTVVYVHRINRNTQPHLVGLQQAYLVPERTSDNSSVCICLVLIRRETIEAELCQILAVRSKWHTSWMRSMTHFLPFTVRVSVLSHLAVCFTSDEQNKDMKSSPSLNSLLILGAKWIKDECERVDS